MRPTESISPDYKDENEIPLDYPWITSQVGEAIEHLTMIQNAAKNETLSEPLLKMLTWSSIMHLNTSYNLRHLDSKEKTNIHNYDKAAKLPEEFLDLLP